MANSSLTEALICGPFNIGTWDAINQVYLNGHHLYISEDKLSLEVYETDSNGRNITPPVCTQSLNNAAFTGIIIRAGQLEVGSPKATHTIHTEIDQTRGLKSRLTEINDEHGSPLTSFIGTDDLRQGFVFFSNCLETLTKAGINLRYDSQSNKLIVEY